jgi:hypothetical protein
LATRWFSSRLERSRDAVLRANPVASVISVKLGEFYDSKIRARILAARAIDWMFDPMTPFLDRCPEAFEIRWYTISWK